MHGNYMTYSPSLFPILLIMVNYMFYSNCFLSSNFLSHTFQYLIFWLNVFVLWRCRQQPDEMAGSAKCENQFDCSLCLERFKDPRILHCFHSFCRDCLNEYLENKRCGVSGARFECPLCRTENVLPEGGVDGIQKNFYLEEKPAHVSKSEYPLCAKHEKEDLRFYCRTCDHPICRDCKVVEHWDHKIDMVKDVIAEAKVRSGDALNAVEKVLINDELAIRVYLEPEIVNINAALEKAQGRVNVLTNEIESFTTSMNDLLCIFKEHRQRKKKLLLSIDTEFEQKRVYLNETKQWINDVLHRNGPDSVLKRLKELDEKLGEIRQTKYSAWPQVTVDDVHVDIELIGKEFQNTADTILQNFDEFSYRVSRYFTFRNSINVLYWETVNSLLRWLNCLDMQYMHFL